MAVSSRPGSFPPRSAETEFDTGGRLIIIIIIHRLKGSISSFPQAV